MQEKEQPVYCSEPFPYPCGWRNRTGNRVRSASTSRSILYSSKELVKLEHDVWVTAQLGDDGAWQLAVEMSTARAGEKRVATAETVDWLANEASVLS